MAWETVEVDRLQALDLKNKQFRSEYLSVRITPQQSRMIDENSAALGMTPSSFVASLLEDYLEHIQKQDSNLNSKSSIPISIRRNRMLKPEEISFSDEVILEDGVLNFYVNCDFDVDDVFGTHVCTDENDDWLNVYAEYDIDSAQVDKHLILNLCRGDGTETVMVYDLNANEREILHNKMQEFCGQSLDDYAQSLCDEPTMELE